MESYFDYKPSGIEWVGDIPAHWNVLRNNRLFRISKKPVGNNWSTTQLLSLTKKGIVAKDINAGGGKQPESFETYQIVEKDDVVLCLFDIDVSAVFSDTSKLDGMISPAYKVLKCTEFITPEYSKWWFDAVNSGRYYLIYTKSLRKTIDNEGFGNILTVVPPLPEQRAIAQYLCEKCGDIDLAIAEARASIDDYYSLKMSIVTAAVTSGINNQESKKECSINGIPVIPESWSVYKLKRLCGFHNGDRSSNYPSGDDFKNEGIPFVGADALNDYNVDLSLCRFISREKYDSLSGLKIRKNDILYTLRGSTIGKCAIARFDEGTVASSLTGIRIESVKLLDPDYLLLCLQSNVEYNQRIVCINGSTAPNLSAENVSQYRIPVPDIATQKAIVEATRKTVQEIEALLHEKKKLVADLEAYRQAIIFEVVSGKRKVV